MKLLLKQNVDKLGSRGDVVKVSAGFGRNYLLPQGLAVEPTKDNLLRLEAEKKKYAVKEMEERSQFVELAERLKEASCTVQAKADEEGHLFGSVSEKMIADAFTADGIALDAKSIHLADPIKELGVYEVSIQLHPEIEATTKVWVVEED